MATIDVNWVKELNIFYQKAVENSNAINNCSLYPIAKGLFQSINYHPNIVSDVHLLERVHFIAEKKLEAYNQSWLGLFERIFSALRNLFALGICSSSAYLMFKASEKILAELKKGSIIDQENPLHQKNKNDLLNLENHAAMDYPQPPASYENTQPNRYFNEVAEAPFAVEQVTKEAVLASIKKIWPPKDKDSQSMVLFWEKILAPAEIDSWSEDFKSNQFKIVMKNPYKISLNLRIVGFGATCCVKNNIEFTTKQVGNRKVITFINGQDTGFIGKYAFVKANLQALELENGLVKLKIKNPSIEKEIKMSTILNYFP